MNQNIAVSVVFVLALFMNIMDITIVNVALPQLGRDLGATQRVELSTASGSHARPDLTAYHVAFLVAAGIVLLATIGAWTVHDEDAESTRVRPRPRSKIPA